MPSPPFTHRAPARSRLGILVTMVLLAAVAVAAYSIAIRTAPATLVGSQDPPVTASASSPLTETAFPLPRRAEMALGRARSLALRGRLHEALTDLDLVRPTDPEKPDADRLRSDIQRQLLELSTTSQPSGAPVLDAGGARRP
jgi:hypothetical protein